jgi:KipI family sensor histidine kinase inhibitor
VSSDAVAFGDRAWLVPTDDLDHAHRLADAVERDLADGRAPLGTREAVVGMSSVVVHLDPPWLPAATEGVTEEGRDAASDADENGWREWLGRCRAAAATAPARRRAPRDPVAVLTVFDGPDLDELGALLGTDGRAVADLLAGAALRVAFVGFSPGFPYLVGLPDELARVPRRPTPRTEVPAGSVAVAGGFAGIYPQATPGGWWLVGRTSLRLFDPSTPPFALLRAGDPVHLARVAPGEPGSGRRRPGPRRRPPLSARGARHTEVVEPGTLSTVQDIGRRGVAGIGIPSAGPADSPGLRLANRLAGNPDGEAAVEVTATGPQLRFGSAAHVAVVGAGAGTVEVSLDGRAATDSATLPVAPGQTLGVGRVLEGLRAYVAVSGGLALPRVVGSRASDLLSGLGPGPLRAGDRLPLGPTRPPRGRLGPGPRRDRSEVRVMAGPHVFPEGALEALLATAWTVTPASSRVGLRLEHASRRLPPGPAVTSTGMATGAVQVPPDGRPIVLLPDHATVGGYPVLATVIGADLPVLGQLAPGAELRFSLVDRAAAVTAAWHEERELATRVHDWYPTRPAT